MKRIKNCFGYQIRFCLLYTSIKLYRKSVGIPSGLTRNHIALHGAVSRDHILDNTGKYVSDMRFSVCGRRSVIEYVRGSFSAAVDTLFKDLFIFPEFLNLFFPCLLYTSGC